MSRSSFRVGFTLLEVLIALTIGMGILGVVSQLMVSGSKMFARGVAAARGPEAAILLMDRFEEDVVQILQAPGDPRPPARITEEGRRLTFYRSHLGLSTPAVSVGVPASWGASETREGSGRYHPVRDGEVLEEIEFGGWSLELLPPDPDEGRRGWFLSVEARFPTDAGGDDYLHTRLVYLPQPSSNLLHFLAHGRDLLPSSVQLLAPPREDPGFAGLGPPSSEAAP